MAKLQAESTIRVAFGRVAWFPDLNVRQEKFSADSGTSKTLIRSFANSGFDHVNERVVVSPIELLWPEKELAKRAVEERTAEIARLEAAGVTNQEAHMLAVVYKKLYTHNGKVIVPDLLGCTGNRRSMCFPLAMVLKVKEAGVNADVDKLIDDQISVLVMHFASPMEREIAQIRENEHKALGFEKLSIADKLHGAKELFELGANNSVMRNAFKDSEGQKLWHLCNLNQRWPKVRIFERLLADPTKVPDALNYTSIPFKDLPVLSARSSQSDLDDWNRKEEAKGNARLDLLTETTLDEQLVKLAGGGGPKPKKIMSADQINGVCGQNPIKVIQTLGDVIKTHNTELLKPFLGAAPSINVITDLAKDSDFESLQTVLTKVGEMKGKARKAIVAEMLSLVEKAS